MQIQAGTNKVAVSLPHFYNDTLTHGKLTVHIDPLYNPTAHVKTRARITGLPLKLDEDYIPFMSVLEKAEFIYFDFKALDEMDYVLDGKGNKIYFVPIELIYAATIEDAAEDPEIYPNTGIVLCEPFYGFDVEEVELQPGKKSVARTRNGLVVDINPRPDDRIAIVRHIGPLRRNIPDQQNFSTGNLVFRESFTNYEYEIAGTKFFVVNFENIDGILEGTNFAYNVSDSVRNEYHYDIDATKSISEAMQASEAMMNDKKIY